MARATSALWWMAAIVAFAALLLFWGLLVLSVVRQYLERPAW